MKAKISLIMLAALICISATACSGYKERTLDYLGKRPTTGKFFEEDTTPIVETNYKAAIEIGEQLEERLPAASPITVSVFRMRESQLQTTLAQVVTEQIASKLAQQGFAIVADSSKFPTTSPDDKDVPLTRCVLAGAYTVGPELIFVTAAVSAVSDGEILGSYDWTLPLNSETRALLPIKDSPTIQPMVNTSGPLTQPKIQTIQIKPQTAPGFEQNIMD